MRPHKCPDCGCFMSKVVAIANRWDGVLHVVGWCKRHGWRVPDNWDADDFEEGEE